MPGVTVMKKKLTSEELQTVLQWDQAAQYQYFLQAAVQCGGVFGLRDQLGWVFVGDEDGEKSLALWPRAEFAALCATEEWQHNEPTALSLEELLVDWLPNLVEEDAQVAVFPTPAGFGTVIFAAELLEDLQEELAALPDS